MTKIAWWAWSTSTTSCELEPFKMKRILGVLPLLLAFLAGCEQQGTTPTADEAATELPADQVFWGFKGTVLNPEGVRSATIASDSAYSFENAGRFDLFGVNLQF